MSDIDKLIAEVSPRYRKKNGSPKGPAREFNLIYDSASEGLEPLYFWILDFMNNVFKKVEKITDNFASSPGSGHFSELQGKASQMQQEASRTLGTVNNILKGVLNLIYDLKEFKIRLSHYDQANLKNKEKSEAGLLALKQIWMDKVDVLRGQGSINAMTAGDLNFVTLRDAFLTSKSLKEIDKIDLNERVKRILKPRLQEFFEWRKRSEQELRKRFEIERLYLKSQVDALKLNARWAKPYLKAAQQLTSNERLGNNPALVNVFNTLILELSLMGQNPLDVREAILQPRVAEGYLPKDFAKMKNLRKYYSIVFVDFTFRGIPSKAGQHYVFGGRVDVKFKAYSLNEDEIELLKEKLGESDIDSSLKLVQGMTDDSLSQLKLDINEFLNDEEKETKKSENTNPFTALFSFRTKMKKKEDKKEKLKKLKEKGPKKENYAEQYLREVSEVNAKNTAFTIYDIYKKGHGMASIPYGGGEEEANLPKSGPERFFKV